MVVVACEALMPEKKQLVITGTTMIYLSCIGMHSLCRKLPPNTIESTGVITAWIQPDGKKTVSPPFTTHLQGGQKK